MKQLVRAIGLGDFSGWAKTLLLDLSDKKLISLSLESDPECSSAKKTSQNEPILFLIESSTKTHTWLQKAQSLCPKSYWILLGQSLPEATTVDAYEHQAFSVWNETTTLEKVQSSLELLTQTISSNIQVGHVLRGLKSSLVELSASDSNASLVTELRTAVQKIETNSNKNPYWPELLKQLGHTNDNLPFSADDTLSDAMMMVSELEKTGSLWITSRKNHGAIHFLQGKPIAATAGRVNSLKAIYRMFLWDEPKFTFERLQTIDTKISKDLGLTLGQICERGNEFRENFQLIAKEVPPPHIRLQLHDAKINGDIHISHDDFATLSSVVEFGLVSQVLDYNTLPDSIIYNSLITLRKMGLVKVLVKIESAVHSSPPNQVAA